MLKIKVNLDKRKYEMLLNDMKLFKIIKNDGSVNKNKFINILFENYYIDYIEETNSIISKTKKLMQKYNYDNYNFANELALILYDYNNNSCDIYYNESLTFYLSEENEFIFNTLNNNLGASGFFRKLINRYLEYPQYKREQIIFKKIINPINEAISNNELIKIKLETSEIIIKPYKIGTSKEEIYTYLLGIVKNNPVSLHILKIKHVLSLKTNFKFIEDEICNLNLINKLGIQFPFKNICKAEIKLTPDGVKLFDSKYLNRPEPVNIIGNIFYFECSFDQLFNYFLTFDNKMEILAPINLKESIYKKYKSYVDNYEKNLSN